MNKKPVLILIAGPNGSGKTSVTEEILKHKWIEDCVYINADIIANEQFGGWNSNEAVLKAAQFAQNYRDECIENKRSFIFETVFSAQEKIDFVIKAKKAGFFIRLFFVSTNHPSINASRIAHRVMEGGHDVPITKIISRYSKSISNCGIVATIVDRLYVYDNSIENKSPTLLFRAENGKIKKAYLKINNWAKSIYTQLEN